MRHWRLFVGALVSMALIIGVSAAVLSAGEGAEGTEAKKPDIVDTLIKAENCSTLLGAVKAAELVETLKGEGPFTIFAPTNAAWEKMPEERRAKLLSPDSEAGKERLSELLLNHVVTGKIMAADLTGRETLGTQAGFDVKILQKEDKVLFGNATITQTDIECSNGVIHLIDAVVRPGGAGA